MSNVTPELCIDLLLEIKFLNLGSPEDTLRWSFSWSLSYRVLYSVSEIRIDSGRNFFARESYSTLSLHRIEEPRCFHDFRKLFGPSSTRYRSILCSTSHWSRIQTLIETASSRQRLFCYWIGWRDFVQNPEFLRLNFKQLNNLSV